MIRSVGGNSNADSVYRALERIFSLQVLASINWGGKVVSGQPKKHGLVKTKVAEAILGRRNCYNYTDSFKILFLVYSGNRQDQLHNEYDGS